MMRMNQNNQCVLNEQDVVTAWLKDRDITMAVFDEPEPIQQYNDWCFAQDIDATIQTMEEYTGDDYVEHCVSNWNLPDEYRTFSVHQYCLDKCDTPEKQQRIALELGEFEKRGMIPVLIFLKYLVDTCKENKFHYRKLNHIQRKLVFLLQKKLCLLLLSLLQTLLL